MKLFIKKSQYGYSTKLKNEYNGEVSEMWLNVNFKKGDEPEGDCQIEINDMFLSCYKSKEEVKPKLIVTNYKVLGEQDKPVEEASQAEPKKDYFAEFGKEHEDDFEDSLPF